MKSKSRLNVLILLNTIVFIPVMIDVLLHVFDIWGAHAYSNDLSDIWWHLEDDDERGYRMEPGSYAFTNWTMTINPDGTRRIPETAQGGCTIAMIGDSVTMGHGVSDGDTFTAQLARDYPLIHFINAGVEGYNAAQIRATRDTIASDAYLYLLIDNDADARVEPFFVEKPFYRLSLPLYYYIWQSQHSMITGLPQDMTAFDAAIAELKQDNRVVIIGLEGNKLPLRADVPVVPYWTHVNSFADSHPNREGHSQIAAGIQPYIDVLIDRVC